MNAELIRRIKYVLTINVKHTLVHTIDQQTKLILESIVNSFGEIKMSLDEIKAKSEAILANTAETAAKLDALIAFVTSNKAEVEALKALTAAQSAEIESLKTQVPSAEVLATLSDLQAQQETLVQSMEDKVDAVIA